jgi:hypothetical protein
MKNKLLILTLLVVSISCSQNNDCEDKQLTIHHFNCANTKYSLKIDLQNDYTIIRSKDTYDSKVTGDCHPTIDFSTYDLVIGRQSSRNENDTITYDLRKTCPDDELALNIDIIQSAATRPDNVVYHALIPKLGDEETIKIRVNVK